MCSILIWSALVLCALVFLTLVMWVAARAVGARRGRLWHAAAAAVLCLLVGVAGQVVSVQAAQAITEQARRDRPDPDDAAVVRAIEQRKTFESIAISVVQLALLYAVMRVVFKLSAGRAFAPFGAHLVGSVCVFVVGWFGVRPYLVEGFVLPTGSMTPTVAAQDRVTACKLLQPRRWDIVAYHDDSSPRRPIYCKRVVALPGETLAFDGHGGITINGAPVAMPPAVAGRYFAASAGPARRQAKYTDGEPIHLNGQQMFVIGDNVDGSYDCRFTGPADVGALVGVIDAVYWPPSHARLFRRDVP